MDFDSFKIKNNFLQNSYISSLMLRRNKQFNFKKKINQEMFNSPFRQNILPIIHKYNSLNTTKQLPKNRKFILKRKNINPNYLKVNIKFNVTPLKYTSNFKTRKDRPKFTFFRKKEENSINYTEDKNKLNNKVKVEGHQDKKEKEKEKEKEIKKENKIKILRKIINVYKGDEMKKSANKIKIEKMFKREGNINKKNNGFIKPNSMFMTEMNFLINDKSKINNQNNMKKSRELKSINYDFLSFKELLKHIEDDKKKIINNQNDLDDMLKTTRDTYFEIWKCNHH